MNRKKKQHVIVVKGREHEETLPKFKILLQLFDAWSNACMKLKTADITRLDVAVQEKLPLVKIAL